MKANGIAILASGVDAVVVLLMVPSVDEMDTADPLDVLNMDDIDPGDPLNMSSLLAVE